MSKWEEHKMEEKIQTILDEQFYSTQDHHLGRPFLSAYQIAIEFAKRFSDDFNSFDMQIGGKGIGEHSSFSQYIGRELSRRLKEHTLQDIQGGFFSNLHLIEIEFSSIDGPIHSSATESQYPVSMFRSTKPAHK